MNVKGPLLAVVTVAALLAASAHHAGRAAAARHAAGYVNPLAGQQWAFGHIDQGVDWKPAVPTPVRAIGPGVVIYSSNTDCLPHGWPDCHVIGYRLTAGRAKGGIVYVAEHLENLAPRGTRIRHAGQVIATALPGYPNTEWGWADCTGSGPVVHYNGAADGTPMAGGLAFARFLRHLGADTAQDPGPGPDIVRSC